MLLIISHLKVFISNLKNIVLLYGLSYVVGVIKGKDSKKVVIISAHFDHLGIIKGKIMRGALDNASGVSSLIKIANVLKEKSKGKPFALRAQSCFFIAIFFLKKHLF
ncbi:M28 family peptidase [Clostridium estertheticum]|uniref:M28 family peptidase n=1 Tax=Clostridium estertheticum TaxID=238834 RepID=UPI001C7D982C|nr:M28 family peptidase [Clostridium estertheticum]MBX4265470.1 M28 family peptidase [Clostridium estertheticum]WLC91180.1 M28 family peptidase [Clostridium estertheticum]